MSKIEYENLPVPYQSLDENGNILRINHAWLSELGYDLKEVVGKNFSQFLHPDYKEHFKQNFPYFKRAGKVRNVEFQLTHKDGYSIDVSFNGCIESSKSGKFKYTHCVFQNITKQKEAEREKEFLMRELNHRTKNNLNMVSSLISLKQMALENKIDLSDIANQIKTISLVHEKLYKTDNIEYINFSEYIQDLLLNVFEGHGVSIINNMRNYSLDARKAVSLGLVVNEIATNALKYGFTENKEFSISMIKEDEFYILKVTNNGNPFPEDKNLEDKMSTLGIQLIISLVAQVKGTIELVKNPTTFIIKFPIN